MPVLQDRTYLIGAEGIVAQRRRKGGTRNQKVRFRACTAKRPYTIEVLLGELGESDVHEKYMTHCNV